MAVAETVDVAQDTQEIPMESQYRTHLYSSADSVGEDQVTREVVASFTADADFFFALQQMGVCSGKEDRPVLAGVFVGPHASGDGLELVSTDTYRLWIKHVPAKDVNIPEGIANGLIIPKEFIKKVIPQIIKENGGKRNFHWKAQNVPFEVVETTTVKTYNRRTENTNWKGATISVFEHDDLVRVQYTSRKMMVGTAGSYETDLVVGQFVNWPKVIPPMGSVKQSIGIAGKALAPALAFCGAVADQDSSRVILHLDEEGTLTIRAAYYESLEGAKAEAEYPIPKICQKGDGDVWEPFKIGLNYQYMQDFIGDYPGYLQLYFFGPLNAAILQMGSSDTYVQMPMQMFDAAGNPISE